MQRLSILLIPVLLGGCALVPVPTARTAHPEASRPKSEAVAKSPPSKYATQEGLASWYGRPFHGRAAASGEIYDQWKMTAAHRSLPFGTWVRVTDLDTEKSVQVRINDRGPYVKGRILDLSRAAGVSLGIGHRGVARVRMEVLDTKISSIPPRLFAVQVAAFKYEGRAKNYVETKLKGLKFAEPVRAYLKAPCRLSEHYRVRFGPFTERSAAAAATRRLRRHGIESMLTQESPDLFPTFLRDGSPVQVASTEDTSSEPTEAQSEITVAPSSQAR